ncbi:YIP1 family protein [Flavobacterium terrisoli]|uniref:YIP1 family protein n=1 Tax=Flavobacterium terrisoli TaxID=3242195 RepID=UPI002542AA36|nr:YIP1 family protein [Flavobacterium buctense]
MLQKLILHPRDFFSDFSSVKNQNHIIILLMLAGIERSFDRAMVKNLGDKWELGSVILFSVIMGALLGWLSFYIYAALVSWTSGWINSKISTKNVVEIIAYASVPLITSLVVLLFQIIIFENQMFQSSIFIVDYSFEYFAFYISLALQILLSVYSLIMFIIGLSVIQKISMAKATLNVFLPLLFFLTIAAVIIGIVEVLK